MEIQGRKPILVNRIYSLRLHQSYLCADSLLFDLEHFYLCNLWGSSILEFDFIIARTRQCGQKTSMSVYIRGVRAQGGLGPAYKGVQQSPSFKVYD